MWAWLSEKIEKQVKGALSTTTHWAAWLMAITSAWNTISSSPADVEKCLCQVSRVDNASNDAQVIQYL